MGFANPAALWLCLIIPLFIFLGWPERGSFSRRDWIALFLRLFLVLALIASLAGFQINYLSRDLSVVFLVDASDSIPASAQSTAQTYIQDAIRSSGSEDQSAIIIFGGDALVEKAMAHYRELGPLRSIPIRSQTDLNEALRLASALLSTDSARRIVVLSDGNDTVRPEKLADTAQILAASGIQILAVPLVEDSGPEAMISSIMAPDRLLAGENFSLEVSTQSNQPIPAKIRILANGQSLYLGRITLERGLHALQIPLKSGEPGIYQLEIMIEPEQDHFYQNNTASAILLVEGSPQILIVAPPAGEDTPALSEPRPDETAALLAALRGTNIDPVVVHPSQLPSDLGELSQYAGIILVDVPAADLLNEQMSAIQAYVRDLGGGLIGIGGPTSFGVGGYYQTPLEEVLPVEMQIKDELRRPKTAILFIIDHSGSMSETSGGVVKLEMAKEAAIRSVDLLFSFDRVGVVAFDETASWVVPMTDLTDRDAVKNAIASIRSGGGTDILAGIQAAARVFPGDPATLKHIILLTDGGADPTGIPELVRRLHNQHQITLSVVGVGSDAAPFLPGLAEIGTGRYHFTADPAAIPSIFTEETTLALRSYIIEHSFFPQQVSPSPILAGIQTIPSLQGYVGTTIKNTARPVLVSDLGDPIAAVWQYGLGRAFAFTSDATGRWARNWLNWEHFAAFWGQAVSYILKPEPAPNLDIQITEEASGLAALTVEARQDDANQYLNNYQFQAQVRAPDGASQTLMLSQVAPGQYQSHFMPTGEGAYFIGIKGVSKGSPPAAGTEVESILASAGWVLAYPAEYRQTQAGLGELEKLVEITGGKIVDRTPSDVFRHNLPAGSASRPVWPWLLLFAALILPLDIGVRRLMISAASIRARFASLGEKIRRRRWLQPQAEPKSERLETLRQAKARVAHNQETKTSPGAQGSENQLHRADALQSSPSAGDSRLQTQSGVEKTETNPPEIRRHIESESQARPSENDGNRKSTAASLLERKRKKSQEKK